MICDDCDLDILARWFSLPFSWSRSRIKVIGQNSRSQKENDTFGCKVKVKLQKSIMT